MVDSPWSPFLASLAAAIAVSIAFILFREIRKVHVMVNSQKEDLVNEVDALKHQVTEMPYLREKILELTTQLAELRHRLEQGE